MTLGQKEKLIKRLKSKPRDFTFDEAETLLGYQLIEILVQEGLI